MDKEDVVLLFWTVIPMGAGVALSIWLLCTLGMVK